MKIIGLIILMTIAAISEVSASDDKQVIFYNSYGYLEGDEWVIPMRIYVMEARPRTERVTARLLRRYRDLDPDELFRFRSRLTDIVADSEWRERVSFIFNGDETETEYFLTNASGNRKRTSLNGVKTGKIRISTDKADSLMSAQNSENGWLTFRAVSQNHRGEGRVQLIEAEGISVISDVDDTVKITEIPAGARVVVRNTFIKDYAAAPRMADLYHDWDNAAFHYVSGSPWQLYRPLSSFLWGEEAGFPEGTFHMKQVTKNLFSLTTWSGLRNFITNEMITYDQKLEQISEIMQHFPGRQFILVGDSGERDPEVYREINNRFPDQVAQIIIRDVINDRNNRPERLEGMSIIPAPTIQPGVTSK
jgi:hypothetical protein